MLKDYKGQSKATDVL
jgi:hypothetical protein